LPWRALIAICYTCVAGFTLGRGILGGFMPHLYPNFAAPHPINIGAQMAANITLVLPTVAVLVMLDLDKFKTINDTLGHDVGDRVLQLFGKVLRDQRRSSDLAARMGGEEFALLLPHTDAAAAILIEQRLRNALKEACAAQPQLAVDYSAGLAMQEPRDDSLSAFMVRADDALYRAKDQGRGRLQTAD
jgi:diguanylate cyclase (GGDEF)-like protein